MKILPMQKPWLNSMPQHANLFAVLQNNIDMTREWALENHIILNGRYDLSDKKSPFMIDIGCHDMRYWGRAWEMCPFIRAKVHDINMINKKWDSFTSFTKDAIDEKLYVYVFVYTKSISLYQLNDDTHSLFISGYDDTRQVFLGSDYFGDVPKYDTCWIPYKEIEDSYQKKMSLDDATIHPRGFGGVCLWQYNPYGNAYTEGLTYDRWSIPRVIWRLKQLVGDIWSPEYMGIHPNMLSGLNVYDMVSRIILENTNDTHILYLVAIRIAVLIDHVKILEEIGLYMYNSFDVELGVHRLEIESVTRLLYKSRQLLLKTIMQNKEMKTRINRVSKIFFEIKEILSTYVDFLICELQLIDTNE